MAIPETANYALDLFMGRHGVVGGARLLGISHQRLSLLRQRDMRIPVELVPLLVVACHDPLVTMASLRPDYSGFHLVASLARSRTTAHLLGENTHRDVALWTKWAQGQRVGVPSWLDQPPDA